jgi:AAA domain (Cdc48 subfamily)
MAERIERNSQAEAVISLLAPKVVGCSNLIGTPPGNPGHRKGVPLLTQGGLKDATSFSSDLALVLFDEIEKASPSLTKPLLGILDKRIIRSGDNTEVTFEKSLIFFTSNPGPPEIMKAANPEIGFHSSFSRLKPEFSRQRSFEHESQRFLSGRSGGELNSRDARVVRVKSSRVEGGRRPGRGHRPPPSKTLARENLEHSDWRTLNPF